MRNKPFKYAKCKTDEFRDIKYRNKNNILSHRRVKSSLKMANNVINSNFSCLKCNNTYLNHKGIFVHITKNKLEEKMRTPCSLYDI